MNPAPLGQLIVPAVGIAISPVSIVAIILLLLSPRARTASIGFVLGWTFGIVAAVTAFALLSAVVPVRVPDAADAVLGIIQVVVGVILLTLTAVMWVRRRRTEAAEQSAPVWMRMVDRATFPLALAVGFAMAANPPNLLLSLAGGAAMGVSGLTGGELALAIAVFTIVAASTVLIPAIAHFIAADQLQRPLDRLRVWLTQHGTAILTVLFIVLGLVSVAQGLSELSA